MPTVGHSQCREQTGGILLVGMDLVKLSDADTIKLKDCATGARGVSLKAATSSFCGGVAGGGSGGGSGGGRR